MDTNPDFCGAKELWAFSGNCKKLFHNDMMCLVLYAAY